jgi:peptidyl-dipeptidase A
MRSVTLFAAVFLAATAPVLAQNSASSKPPTVAEAQAFLDRANADLLELSTDAAHAQWLAETDINEDTESTSALLNKQATARTLELTAESHRFDHLELPADLRRQIMLMQVNAPAAPKDPKLLAEQTTLAAQLTGMYGKGKYCLDSPAGSAAATGANCLGIDAISDKMAKSRDPEELTKLWVGWHAIGAPMRERYTRFIALQNIGARELGYKDTGAL